MNLCLYAFSGSSLTGQIIQRVRRLRAAVQKNPPLDSHTFPQDLFTLRRNLKPSKQRIKSSDPVLSFSLSLIIYYHIFPEMSIVSFKIILIFCRFYTLHKLMLYDLSVSTTATVIFREYCKFHFRFVLIQQYKSERENNSSVILHICYRYYYKSVVVFCDKFIIFHNYYCQNIT